MKRIAIVQSNYIPWKGYFDLIASVDEFILYDDMQYTRRDWRNRNQIKTPEGLHWLTVPVLVKGKYHQTIRETQIQGTEWALNHWKTLAHCYRRSAHFESIAAWLEPIYRNSHHTHLSTLNRQLIEAICQYLNIKTTLSNSWDYPPGEGKSERLANLCVHASGTTYVSGPAAKSYLDPTAFTQKGLDLVWFDYSGYPVYPQTWGDFKHEVSILDLLFNCGSDSPQFMKYVPGNSPQPNRPIRDLPQRNRIRMSPPDKHGWQSPPSPRTPSETTTAPTCRPPVNTLPLPAQADPASQPSVSVVVPVYGCASCLVELCAELEIYLPQVSSHYEILLVDDRSPDDSWSSIKELRLTHNTLVGIRLSRNYGQQIAIAAGLAHAKGDYAIVMDCDLQDPPRLIPNLFKKCEEGYDIVLTRRIHRSHSPFRILVAKIYSLTLRQLTDVPMDAQYGSLSLFSRKVINAYLLFREPKRHHLLILQWLGFRTGCIDYVQSPRHSGTSSYTFQKLLRHAVQGLLFQSSHLLHGIVFTGLSFLIVSIATALLLTLQFFRFNTSTPELYVTTLLVFCTGTILISVGLVGIYVEATLAQTKQRPLYVEDEVLRHNQSW